MRAFSIGPDFDPLPPRPPPRSGDPKMQAGMLLSCLTGGTESGPLLSRDMIKIDSELSLHRLWNVLPAGYDRHELGKNIPDRTWNNWIFAVDWVSHAHSHSKNVQSKQVKNNLSHENVQVVEGSYLPSQKSKNTSETGSRNLFSFSTNSLLFHYLFEMCYEKCLKTAWSKCHLFPQKSRFISKHVLFFSAWKLLILRRISREIQKRSANFVTGYSPSQEMQFSGFSETYFSEKLPQRSSIQSNRVVKELKLFARIFFTKSAFYCSYFFDKLQ